MPQVGYGTFLSEPGEIGPAIKEAIRVGYRHIDCAPVYKNEPEIGAALAEVFAEGKVKRQDLWVTSKLNSMCMHPEEVIPCLKKTLKDLKLDYLDLYLVHLPVPVEQPEGEKHRPRRLKGHGLQDVWRQMEAAYDQGLVKAIGVSNYNTIVLNDCLNYAKVPPAVNQIELHPYFAQLDMVKFCKDNKIVVTAYSSLGAPGLDREEKVSLLDDKTIKKIADKHKKKPAQVLLRWSMEKDIIVIPKSVNKERIKENFDLFDFKLTDEEVKEIDGLNKNLRSFTQNWMGIPTFH